MLDIILCMLWSFLVAIFAVPSIIDVARRKKLFDKPNHRTIHELLTPRLGGLAIFAGFMSAVTIFGEITPGVQQLLAGCLILFFIGVKDDIITVSVFKKFFVQLLAAGIVMFIGDVKITNFQGFMNVYALDQGISYGFTFLVIIGITNAINLIDGLDGLAGSLVLLISFTFGIFFFSHNISYAFVAFSLAGAVLGFLRYNFHNARIFMGDTGSLICGFIIAIMAIEFVELKLVSSSPALAVGILIIPVFDTIRVFSIRILNGRSPFHPDKNHIHHWLLSLNFSQMKVVLILIGFNLLTILVMINYDHLGNTKLLVTALAIAFLFSFSLFLSRQQKQVHG